MRKSFRLAMAMGAAAISCAGLLAYDRAQAQLPEGGTPPPAANPAPGPNQRTTPEQTRAVDNSRAPDLFYAVDAQPLKLPPEMNFGETLGVAINSKGYVVVLNHPGSAASGPLYGNASTQLLLFGPDGRYLREVGKGVYGLGYAHSVRFDKYDNLWVVDKGTDAVVKFDPQFRAVLNLGRRAEGFDSGQFEHPKQWEVKAQDGWFRAPTDVAWDTDDNIYVSDGYINSRIAKFTKDGDWVRSWGQFGRGGQHANENAYFINNPHNMQIDRQNNIYVGDRGNRRIHVYDKDGKFQRFMYLNAPYDKDHHPTLGDLPANTANRPDETAPWALCISTKGPTQYLFAVDSEPSRVYKMTLDGKIVGKAGGSGHRVGQLNWPHGLACPSENEVWVADMNNWRIQKFTFYPTAAAAAAAQAAIDHPRATRTAKK